jgi:hypothetical protein
MNDNQGRDLKRAYVEAYKAILRNVLDRRPSGTRQRLATALRKNRSFVSHMSNPRYRVPIPALHLETIFEICHFSPTEKRDFLEAFGQAHPNRLKASRGGLHLRSLRLEVIDLGDPRKNRELDDRVKEIARRLSKLLRHEH